MPSKKPFLPVDNPTLPFWLTERSSLDEIRSTPDLPSESDIVIIGAGYAGVSLAYHLVTSNASTTPPPSITILEARTVCSGATGRNGGHLRPDTYSHIPTFIERYGIEAATELAEFELSHVKAMQDVIRKEQIDDCDLIITRNMNVYLDQNQGDKAMKALDGLKDQNYALVDDIYRVKNKDAEPISGVKGAKTAFSFTSGSIWPYKFIMGLLRKVIEYGDERVNIQTTTPVTSVESNSDINSTEYPHTITTSRGTIKAKKVVFTTNAYTFGLLPEYEPAIIPARGIVAHIAVPEGRRPPHLAQTYIINPDDKGAYDYMIIRPDGTIVVGGAHEAITFPERGPEGNRIWYGNIDDSTLMEPAEAYYDGYMQKYFIGWEESGAYVKEMWTGIMGYSADTAPHVGEVPSRPGQYISAGFNGHGMPVIFLSTKGLAEMVLEGKKFEDVHVPRIYKTSAERLEKIRNGKEGGDIFD